MRATSAAGLLLTLVLAVSSPCADLQELLSAAEATGLDLPKDQVVAQPSATQPPVDNSINPDRYYVGTGDVFQVSIIEFPSVQYEAEVNQNCDVFISDVGILRLGKVTLREATKAIATFVAEKLRNKGEVYVALVAAKTATVLVTGEIASPGTHSLSGLLRVLDAITMANDNVLPSLNAYDFRNVEYANGDSVGSLDLFRFITRNDQESNPYVYPGDRITLRRATQRVTVFGAIKTSGDKGIPIRKNETLGDLLSLLTLDESADSSHVVVQKGRTTNARSTRIASADQWHDVVLEDGDIITVARKENYPELNYASVFGEVARPGTYPIVRDQTTVKEILDLAGGVTRQGTEKEMAVIRHRKSIPEVLRRDLNLSGAAAAGKLDIKSVRPEVAAGFAKMMSISDHTVIALREHGTNVTLEEDDEIFVPRREAFVFISGNVAKPGAYSFRQGKSHRYYVRRAGGYTSRASRTNVFVVAHYGSALQIKDTHAIAEGDIIVVPDSIQNKSFNVFLLPMLQAVATTIMAVVAIVNITNR